MTTIVFNKDEKLLPILDRKCICGCKLSYHGFTLHPHFTSFGGDISKTQNELWVSQCCFCSSCKRFMQKYDTESQI